MRAFFLSILVLLAACKTETVKPQTDLSSVAEQVEIRTPDQLLGELFTDVQLIGIFEDSKTFVDCIAMFPYDTITARYSRLKYSSGFDLKSFVLEHFETPPLISSGFKSDPNRSAAEHVRALWPVLKRESDSLAGYSSLIPLPGHYIVPGGRFREVYYWDSYFTMLGLAESGEFGLIENMLDNFAYLINLVGHIPNGNRSYYVSRSQPPFFAQMVALLAEEQGDSIYAKYREALRKEYEFWMQGSELTDTPILHCVGTPLGIMNRYFDKGETPRQESYREDYRQVEATGGDAKMYSDLRSGAESGWDFSSRWFEDGATLETIETTDIIPVDLNALLYGLEEVLLKCYREDAAFVAALKTQMAIRKDFLDNYCWNQVEGVYLDYNWADRKPTAVKSLAMVFPLFFGMAGQEQANKVAAYLQQHLLKPGGVVTTENNTGQQWDAPNGWAPLQWMAIKGLERYGHKTLARTIAERWVALNEKVYASSGKFVEKYNVEDMSLEAGGGEYPVQDGFGWSNGVYLALKAWLEKS
jgi:alpha,alpha-trehalase